MCLLLSTHIALMYATQERKFEMPCKANRSFVQLMNKPPIMLIGQSAAAVGLCKEEHFCCVELKPESKVQEICDACTQCKVSGFAGIILVNFKDDVSLSEASWELALAHKETVVVVPKRQGDTLLKILGTDMDYAPETLTRFVYVKIFPKLSGMFHQSCSFSKYFSIGFILSHQVHAAELERI